MRSPAAVDCWLAITENRIGPLAYKPQDVVRAQNGTTIQVIHTDAEGRMVLADTLCLAARANPGAIIDYATLTGACVYALTERYSGAFTNRPEARDRIEAAGASERRARVVLSRWTRISTRTWRARGGHTAVLERLKGDHILAARFLSRFVPKTIPWLHLDLAAGRGTAGSRTLPPRSPASACATPWICCAADGRRCRRAPAPRARSGRRLIDA